MSYDSDKTDRIVTELKGAVQTGQFGAAMRLLRRADAGGRLRADPRVLRALERALGARNTEKLVEAFARERCPCCTGGRERCDDCDGQGFHDGTSMCRSCAGLGLRRCSFCNGTSLAGYDWVPRGLRPAVMQVRLDAARQQIDENGSARSANEAPTARDLAARIVALDRCRGVLANAVEQTELGSRAEDDAQRLFSDADRLRTTRLCRQANAKAESSIRALLGEIAARYADRAARAGVAAAKRREYEARARAFASLAGRAPRSGRTDSLDFGDSELQTPRALREEGATDAA